MSQTGSAWPAAPIPAATAAYGAAVAALGDEAENLFARAAGQVVVDQAEADNDVPTDGEVRREYYIHYHCRHLEGFDFEHLTEKQVRGGNDTSELLTITPRCAQMPPSCRTIGEWRRPAPTARSR
jgi:methionine synthase II (cobalamin-independent)